MNFRERIGGGLLQFWRCHKGSRLDANEDTGIYENQKNYLDAHITPWKWKLELTKFSLMVHGRTGDCGVTV